MSTATVEVIAAEGAAIERAENASGRAGEILLEAQHLVVRADTYESASAFLQGVKRLGKEIEAERKALTDPLNAVVKRIMEKFRPATDALAKAEIVVKGKLSAYAEEIERERQERERAAREAQRKAEEKLRQEAEAARQAEEEARRKAEAARRAGDEQAARAAEQDAARKAAMAERREEKAEVVAMSPVLVETIAPAEAEGISYRTSYRAEVVDLGALCAAVLAGQAPAECILANEKFLGATARALKTAMNWPGVRVVAERTVSARS
jgi:hypothetical protein